MAKDQAAQLRDQIVAGQLRPGDRLPDDVGDPALAQLTREGWIDGGRVRRRPDVQLLDRARPDAEATATAARLAEQGSPVDEVLESVRAAIPTPEEATAAEAPEGLPVLLVRREFWSDGVLVEWTEETLAAEAAELRYRLPLG